jgi:hypothetical protein
LEMGYMGGMGILCGCSFIILEREVLVLRGLYPTASVGSRNALHVVGVTPVLHVVRSCTTVMARDGEMLEMFFV